MFTLPKNITNTLEADALIASYVLELLFNGKEMYKCNTKIVVYDDGGKAFFTTTSGLSDKDYKLYDITARAFSIVKDEIARQGWHLIKKEWYTQCGLNWSYVLKDTISQEIYDNPNKTVIV